MRAYCRLLTEETIRAGHCLAQERPAEGNGALMKGLVVHVYRRLPTQKAKDLCALVHALRAASPVAVWGVALGHLLRVAAVPCVFCKPHFFDGGVMSERGSG